MRYPETTLTGTIVSKRVACDLVLSEHSYPPRLRLERHYHSDAFFTLVIAGPFTEQIGQRTEKCCPHSVRFLPPSEPHVDEFPQGARCLHIKVPKRQVDEIETRARMRLGAGRIDSPAMPALFVRLCQEFKHWDDLSEVAVYSLATELLVQGTRAIQQGPRVEPWLKLVEEQVRDRFGDRIRVQELARAAGVHIVHLCRAFRRVHGCTVGEFARRLRVQKACVLLQSTDSPLAEIALAVGCVDQSHLSSVFKRQIGVTPGEYRRSLGLRRPRSSRSQSPE